MVGILTRAIKVRLVDREPAKRKNIYEVIAMAVNQEADLNRIMQEALAVLSDRIDLASSSEEEKEEVLEKLSKVFELTGVTLEITERGELQLKRAEEGGSVLLPDAKLKQAIHEKPVSYTHLRAHET